MTVAAAGGMLGLRTGRGAPFEAGGKLAEGGQGVIFEVVGRPDLVFKRYKPAELVQDATLQERLEVMVRLQPAAWREVRSQHVMLAWPTESVLDDSGFVGYLMPRIDASRSARLLRVWDPSDRDVAEPPTEWLRGFTWRHLVTTGANLALGLEVLHSLDVVIGDFSDANVAVTPEGRVTFFDCDSMQLADAETGRRFLCRVTRPEFTAPELMGVDLQTTFRGLSSDLFALAVHLYQLLLQGEHPFRGNWQVEGDPPREQVLASAGLWTYAGRPELTPRPTAIGIELLPREIAELFRRAFVDGALDPDRRPSAAEWRESLEFLARGLVPCDADGEHWYPWSFPECPWCRHVRLQAARARAAAAPARAGRQPLAGAAAPLRAASALGVQPPQSAGWPTTGRSGGTLPVGGWPGRSATSQRRGSRRGTRVLALLITAGIVAAGVVAAIHFHLSAHFHP